MMLNLNQAATLLFVSSALFLEAGHVAADADAGINADADVNADVEAVATLAPISSIEKDLGYDKNGKLASYHLVYPANGNCPIKDFLSTYDSVAFEVNGLEGNALDLVFPNYDGVSCAAACLERGVDRSIAGHTMPHHHWEENANISDDANANANDYVLKESFKSWFSSSCTRVEVCLMSYWDQQNPVDLYWIDFNGEEVFNQHINYAEKNTRCFHSFIGHNFIAKHNGQIIDSFTVEYPLMKAFGKSPPHEDEIFPGQYDKTIESTLRTEWHKHFVPKRVFSPLGFSKGRLPRDVFAAISSFFYNNAQNKVREEWNARGVFVNWWETDVFFIQIPWDMKRIWQERLADMVSEWAGTKCEQTVMYGLRQYEAGARLLTHVDRLPTHAVSLIVNIAQGNLTEDWPVEVFDHDGRLHEVPMVPGEVVFYESAKNLHSRNRALMGENSYYVNLFTHYRPAGDGPEWHTLPNMHDPVMETEGECKVPDEVEGVDTEHLGYGRVKCADPRLGKYLSPTLFRASAEEDLIEWWRRTSPARDASTEGEL